MITLQGNLLGQSSFSYPATDLCNYESMWPMNRTFLHHWFLMSNVLVSADPKRDFKAIIAWWQDMAQQNGKCSLKPDAFSAQCFSTDKKDNDVQRGDIFQKHFNFDVY